MTKNSTKKIPRLRFKGFEGEWEEKRLGDISSLITKGTTPKEKNNVGEVNFVKIEDINKFSNKIYHNHYISFDEHDNYLKRSKLKENDILFSIAGTLGRIAKVRNIDLPANTNQALAIIRIKPYYDLDFLIKILGGKIVKQYIRKNPTVGAQPNLSLKQLSQIKLKIPNVYEQQKIGSFFAKLDQLIDLQSKKVEQLKKLKRGYLQKMFPQKGESLPRLRFYGFSGEWEERKLGEVGTIKSGYGFPEKYQGGNLGIPFFKVSDMSINGSEMIHSNNYVNNNIIDLKRWKPISPENGSIIFAKVGAALNKNRKRIVFKEFLIDNNMMSYSMDLSWNPYFCFEYFLTLYLPKYAQTGALPSFNSSDINSISFRLPNLNEQNKIGRYFRNLDILLEYNYKKISNLKEIKKSYLQKLFC